MAAVKVEERLRKMERDGLGPNSIDPPRRVLLGIFRRATKAGLWYGLNPVEAWPRRRFPALVAVHPEAVRSG